MNLYNDVINNPDGTYKKIYSCTKVLKSIESVMRQAKQPTKVNLAPN